MLDTKSYTEKHFNQADWGALLNYYWIGTFENRENR